MLVAIYIAMHAPTMVTFQSCTLVTNSAIMCALIVFEHAMYPNICVQIIVECWCVSLVVASHATSVPNSVAVIVSVAKACVRFVLLSKGRELYKSTSLIHLCPSFTDIVCALCRLVSPLPPCFLLIYSDVVVRVDCACCE